MGRLGSLVLRRVFVRLIATVMVTGLVSSSAEAAGVFEASAQPVGSDELDAIVLVDDGSVELHLRARVRGPATTQYAWVIPVPAEPEITAGSTRLFDALERGTVPVFDVEVHDICGLDEDVLPPSEEPSNVDTAPDPPVVSRTFLAEQSSWVLEPEDDIAQSLLGSGYVLPEGSMEVLSAYADIGRSFVVVTYRSPYGPGETLPIRLRFAGTTPTLPLVLASATSAEPVSVDVWLLGDHRAVVTGYRHVTPNLLVVDWLSRGDDYLEMVAEAIQETGADGRAFATLHAGSTASIDRAGLYDPRWDPEEFLSLEGTEVVDELQRQGLMTCFERDCHYHHEAARAAIGEGYTPVGDTDHACPECYGPPLSWVPSSLVDALHRRVVDPGVRGIQMLERWPVVTRLHTTLERPSITVDPAFAFGPGLPDVTSRHRAELRMQCDGDAVVELADGREIFLPQGGPWPEALAELPRARYIDAFETVGSAFRIVDNDDRIATALADHNAAHGWPVQGCRAVPRPLPAAGLWVLLLAALRKRRAL